MNAPGSADHRNPALADHVHAVRLRDGLVLLDIAGDTYFSIYIPAEEESIAALGQAIVEDLFERNLITRGGTRLFPPNPPDEPVFWQDLDAGSPARIGVRDLRIFLVSLICVSFHFYTRSFAALIAGARKVPAPAASLVQYRAVVSRFERMSLSLPFQAQCLFRSHFLLHVLRSYGLAADWIFGVSLFPFHAHCWLAVGDRLVGERFEKTEDLAIILIIKNAVVGAA